MSSLARILADNLKRYRKLRKLSQGELAKKVGVSRQTIANYERAATGVSLDTVSKIASVLGIEEMELMRDPTLGAEPKPVVIPPSPRDVLEIVARALQAMPEEALVIRERPKPYLTRPQRQKAPKRKKPDKDDK